MSHALGDEIGPDLLRHIVRDQLQTTMAHVRDVVAGRAPKPAEDARQVEAVPGWLVRGLIHTAGIPEGEVRRMSSDEVRSRWERFTLGEG